ncbi:MAG: 50S ribosomal protein L33 [Nitrospinota bacterium]
MRETIALQCEPCKRKNYTASRNKKLQTAKMEVSKYCRFCRQHTLHKEVKV